MTIASKSRKNIIETYEKYDRRLTLMTFNAKTGNRVMTYAQYGFQEVLMLMAQRANAGFIVRVYIDLESRLDHPKHIDEYPVLETYLFYPEEVS